MKNESFVTVVAELSEKIRNCEEKYSLVVHERSKVLRQYHANRVFQMGTNSITRSRLLKPKATFPFSRWIPISATLVGPEQLSFLFFDNIFTVFLGPFGDLTVTGRTSSAA
jgi:hypothetical protein